MSKPWLTKSILISIKNKQRLHKTFYRNGNNFEKQLYKNYANLLTRIKKLSKQSYFKQLFDESRCNPRKTWSTIKELINSGSTKRQTLINCLNTETGKVTNAREIAQGLNNFFFKYWQTSSE